MAKPAKVTTSPFISAPVWTPTSLTPTSTISSTITKTSAVKAAEASLEELLIKGLSTGSGDADKITPWNTESLHSLFGIPKWEDTQLYGIFEDLGLNGDIGSTFFVSGGCIVRHLMKTEIAKGDIDIYPLNLKACLAIVSHYEALGFVLEKRMFSYQFDKKIGARNIRVQIMHGNVGGMSDKLVEFDFEHVRLAWKKGRFYSTMGATTALAQRKLHLRYVKEPSWSLLRALKYKSLGFDADQAIHQLALMIKGDAKNVNAAEWESKNPLIEY